MNREVSNTRNQSTTSTSIFSRIQNLIPNWWNGLLRPRKETPVEKILENARTTFVILAVVAFAIMTVIVYGKANPYPHISWLAEFIAVYALIHQWYYIAAARTSREERLAFERNTNRRNGRMFLGCFTLIAASVVISQNFLGIGDVVTGALPWTKQSAEAILSFTNGVVEEYRIFFTR